MNLPPEVDFVLPVYNEGDTIGGTLRELYDVVAVGDGLSIRMITCEDGSKDNTVAVLREAAENMPVMLITGPERKGYSRAVIDGLTASTAPLVGFIDSDGQCDPRDFHKLYQCLMETGSDLVVGYRSPRRDHWSRLLMSRLFQVVYKVYFRVDLKDLSSPYLLITRDALTRVINGNLGILKQGFWWEFYARAAAANLRITQVPVSHRSRISGDTQVYKPSAVPRIAYEHIRGLARLKAELNATGR